MVAAIEEKTQEANRLTKPVGNKKRKNNKSRLVTHIVLALTSVMACGLASLYAQNASLEEIITIGTGYYGLLLIFATLIIGPLNLLNKCCNPVNIMLRRDTGIWAGINILVHVFFSLQLFQKGQILLYFLTKSNAPRTDLFGASSDAGLLAVLVLLPVLFTSSQFALKRLKGKRWKGLQRLTYLIFIFGLLHSLGFQMYNEREAWFMIGTLLATLAVLVAQYTGFRFTLARKREKRKLKAQAGTLVPLPAQQIYSSQEPGLARRRFLELAGGVVLGGIAGGTIATLLVRVQENTPVLDATDPATPQAAIENASQTTSGALAATNEAASPSTTTGKAATTSAPASASTSAAPVLATTGTLGTGKAVSYITPDTRQLAFLVRRNDGSVASFSGICTHQPVNLVFDEKKQALYCGRHDVYFNTQDGKPDGLPATIALKKLNVAIENNGSIVYTYA